LTSHRRVEPSTSVKRNVTVPEGAPTSDSIPHRMRPDPVAARQRAVPCS
jgi:hypothetical protein